MRIFSPKQMALALRADQVQKSEFYAYLFIFIVSCVAVVLPWFGIWDETNVYNPPYLKYADSLVLVLAMVGEIALAYYVNKKGDARRFWYRYFSLALPIGIVLGISAVLVIMLAAGFGIVDLSSYGYADITIITGFHLLSFYMTWKYMKIVSAPPQAVVMH